MLYKDRSISQLVTELNLLGQNDVQMAQCKLIAFDSGENSHLKHFKDHRNLEFFTLEGSSKRYFYSEILPQFTELTELSAELINGFNIALITQLNHQNVTQILSGFEKLWRNVAISIINFQQGQIIDSLGVKNLQTSDLQNQLSFYTGLSFRDIIENVEKANSTDLKVICICDSDNKAGQLRIVLLPSCMFAEEKIANDALKSLMHVKSQIQQILGYIKNNPSQRFQNISRYLTKRHPVTNFIAKILLDDTINICLHWIQSNSLQDTKARLSFYNKFGAVSNLVRKTNVYQRKYIKINSKMLQETQSPNLNKQFHNSYFGHNFKKNSPNNTISKTPSHQKRISLKSSISKLQGKNQNQLGKTSITQFEPTNTLEYCRSLQRKTHKYSLPSETEPIFGAQLHSNCVDFNDSQEIAVLKAQHAVQVSQYHTTIQNLNKKIIILSQQKNLGQLYALHQKQIMMLELKIQQLRNDISTLTQSDQSDSRSLKAMINKMNRQLSELHAKCSAQKLSQNKLTTIQKQLKQCKSNYAKSQTARFELTQELKALTKRLKLKDQEISKLMELGSSSKTLLTAYDTETEHEIIQLIKSISGSSTSNIATQLLQQRIHTLLNQLGKSRDTILYCNDFLLRLQDHIEAKLGDLHPQLVLDCNRFVRGFVVENLSIGL